MPHPDPPSPAPPPRELPHALTGIKPSGVPHLGNYLGMMRPALELAERTRAFYFIADYHALTTLRDPDLLRRHVHELAATWLALGLDPDRTVLFQQSDVPEVCELTWILSCVTGLGLLNRAHAFKDAQAHGKEINAGVFYYPVLMAADILAYDSDYVPVGQDQKQHVEMARDMALAFNHHFGEVLVVPEPLIQPQVATIPGADGRKMSKSYGNVVPLFESPRLLRKTFMRIKTDSTPLEQPKDPDRCPVFALYRLVATPEQVRSMDERYRAGGFGYGHAKQALFEVVDKALAAPRERYRDWMERPRDLDEILEQGAKKAGETAKSTLGRVREATGLKRHLTVERK